MAPSLYVAHNNFILMFCHLDISKFQIIQLQVMWISKAIK